MMYKHFCISLSLKTGAYFTAFVNLLGGLAQIIFGCVQLSYAEPNQTLTLYVVCIVLGLITLGNGIWLLYSIINAKEKSILMYLLTGSSVLMIVIIYSGVNMFHEDSKVLGLVFLLSLFLCYCHLCVYSFYEEVTEYNTVKSGVIEIAYNEKSYVNYGVHQESPVENSSL